MQIEHLNIDNYRCLQDFSLNFSTGKDSSSTILIGDNGTGKSTLLEALLNIMMSFDPGVTDEKVTFNYQLNYRWAGNTLSVKKDGKEYCISIDGVDTYSGKRRSIIDRLGEDHRSIFPERINYFYSGLNNQRVKEQFSKYEREYRKICRKAVSQYWNMLYLANRTTVYDFPRRKYTYCDESFVPIYLTSILCGQTSFEKDHLQNYSHIQGISHISVNLHLERFEDLLSDEMISSGMSGPYEGVYQILEFIDDRMVESFRNNHIYTDGRTSLFDLQQIDFEDADAIAIYNFFEKLQLLFDAEIEVFIYSGQSIISSNYLSEGQRQLIKVLGMLGICKSEDTLILMDEPDSHMNPKWKYELKSIIDGSLSGAINAQALIATHDPLVINGVDKEFIRIFSLYQDEFNRYGRYRTRVILPQEDTAGMGIDGLLQSEYYGLRTSYDEKSTVKFLRRQELYAKLIEQSISDEEKGELRELSREIGSMPISTNSIDFLYDDFIRVFRHSELYSKEYLSYDQMLERRQEIEEIITSLYEAQI